MSTQPMPAPKFSRGMHSMDVSEYVWTEGVIQLFEMWGMEVIDIAYAYVSHGLDGYEIEVSLEDCEDVERIFMLDPNCFGAEKYVFGESDKWTEILDRVDGLYQDYLKIVGA